MAILVQYWVFWYGKQWKLEEAKFTKRMSKSFQGTKTIRGNKKHYEKKWKIFSKFPFSVEMEKFLAIRFRDDFIVVLWEFWRIIPMPDNTLIDGKQNYNSNHFHRFSFFIFRRYFIMYFFYYFILWCIIGFLQFCKQTAGKTTEKGKTIKYRKMEKCLQKIYL